MKYMPKPSTRLHPQRSTRSRSSASVSKAVYTLKKKVKAKIERELEAAGRKANGGKKEVLESSKVAATVESNGGNKEVLETPSKKPEIPFRAARKFPMNWPESVSKQTLPPPIPPTPPQKVPPSNQDDRTITIRRRAINRETTPPNTSRVDENQAVLLKTPRNRSSEPGRTTTTPNEVDSTKTPDRPPPLVETPRTSRRGRRITLRRSWPWEVPDDKDSRRGVKRKLDGPTPPEGTQHGEGEKEEGEVKKRENYFMGSSLQYLFQHDQLSHPLHLPTVPRYLEWDSSRKEVAFRALNYIMTEIPPGGTGTPSRNPRLDNTSTYEVTGKRTTADGGVEYQVEWISPRGNVNPSQEEVEDMEGNHEDYLHFEDYNHVDYFFGGGNRRKRRKKTEVKVMDETVVISATSRPKSLPVPVLNQRKIRASPRILSRNNRAKDANNNPIK